MDIKLKNLGTVNKNEVEISRGNKRVTLVFSYETIVGVYGSKGLKCSVNEWSKTTGKLLNDLQPDKSQRVPHEEVIKYAHEELNAISVIYDL